MKFSRPRRERLFKKSRPLVRKYEQSDAGFLWSAYKNGSFKFDEGLSQKDFLVELAKQYGSFDLLWIVEDENKNFKSGKGQIGLVGIKTDGWVYSPSAVVFKWATPKNVLRSAVAFFQMMRYQKFVGVCEVRTEKKDFEMMKHMEKYGVLYFRGRVPNGSPSGDVFIFSIEGKK